jgi:hypothetical protein
MVLAGATDKGIENTSAAQWAPVFQANEGSGRIEGQPAT